ncbi:MAG TPA: class D sortase [Bacillota bacterium]|nr:class D sortase [Bacillota bacterium]
MKKFSTWLIVLGVIIILVPIVGAVYTNYQQDKLYEEYMNSQELENSIHDLDSAFSENQTTPAAVASPEAVTPAAEKSAPAYKPTVIGRIKIPSADIDLLLVEGSTSKDLNWGAGHLTATPMPGEAGNCAIAGHRNYTFGSYFSRLGEVQIGDRITVEYNKNSYTYEAYEILTVLPDDTSVLAQPKDGAIVTLITCAPKGSNTHRLIIHGKLIS